MLKLQSKEFDMPAINVKEAVKAAKDTLLDLYDDDPPVGMALEEVDKTQKDGRELWAVTLGFDRNKANANSIGSIFNRSASPIEHRVYKTLFIDAGTGAFVKMDIRQVL